MGGEDMELEARAAALESRLWAVEGGVRGRELVLEMFLGQSEQAHGERMRCAHNESNLSMSACE